MGGGRGAKKCIIMHVEDGFWRKVHYNALFGGGKREERISTQSRIPKFRDREQRRRERFGEVEIPR
jgi:hypothetical protein